MKKQLLVYVAVLGCFTLFIFSSFVAPQEEQKKGAPWDIPEKYQKMENPYKDDASIVKYGKTTYMKHCRSCHGNKGLGDGPKAKRLKTFPGLFNSEAFQAQSDGVIYFQSFIGRDEMPNFESKIPDEEDRWAMVNYIRTLK